MQSSRIVSHLPVWRIRQTNMKKKTLERKKKKKDAEKRFAIGTERCRRRARRNHTATCREEFQPSSGNYRTSKPRKWIQPRLRRGGGVRSATGSRGGINSLLSITVKDATSFQLRIIWKGSTRDTTTRYLWTMTFLHEWELTPILFHLKRFLNTLSKYLKYHDFKPIEV